MSDKIRPGRITDEQVSAYRVAYYAQLHAGTAGPDQGNAIRAGLAAAYVQREREIRAGREQVRRDLETRTTPELHPVNLDPYPATVGEVADEIAAFVLELESGPARGIVWELRTRLDPIAPARIVPEPGRCQCVRGEPTHDLGTGYYCGNADVVEP